MNIAHVLRSLAASTVSAGLAMASAQTPCPNQPPTPVVGSTVVWTAAGSPYTVCDDFEIPALATVSVEPGVVLEIESGAQLLVDGVLDLDGTSLAPIQIDGSTLFPPAVELRPGGALEGTFVTLEDGQLLMSASTSLRLFDSHVRGSVQSSTLFFSQVPAFVQLERCLFDPGTIGGSGVSLVDAVSRIRDCRFEGVGFSALRGYTDICPSSHESAGPTEIIGNGFSISRQESIQPLPIDALVVDGLATAPGLHLTGGNYFLGTNVAVSGAQFPLRLEGGVMPDSAPAFSTNVEDAIDVGDGGFAGDGTWAALGLPYRLTEVSGIFPGGQLTIAPDVTVEAGEPDASLLFRNTRGNRILGLPGEPIRFRGLNGTMWGGLQFANHTLGPRLEHVAVRGAAIGVNVSGGTSLIVDRATFLGNDRGLNTTGAKARVRGSLFRSNQTGLRVTGTGNLLAASDSDPNSITSNGVGLEALNGAQADVRNTWWSDASGPDAPGNPNGSGDSVVGPGAASVQVTPFSTSQPPALPPAPVVRFTTTGELSFGTLTALGSLVENDRLTLAWTVPEIPGAAEVVSQRIEFLTNQSAWSGTPLASNIPPDARSWQVTIPSTALSILSGPPGFQIVITDEFGRESVDRVYESVVGQTGFTGLTLTQDFAGMTFNGAEEIPDVTWTGVPPSSSILQAMIVLENDGERLVATSSLGGTGFFFERFPFVSTDRAKVVLEVQNGSDADHIFASDHFSIRHDPRLGLVPPSVVLNAPLTGSLYSGNGVVPVRFSINAPEGLRSIDVMASYDGGERWHPVARELPPTATGFDWELPPNAESDDVRVRVVARDERYQNSSADSAPFAVVPAFATRVQGCSSNPVTLLPATGDFGIGSTSTLAVSSNAAPTGFALLYAGTTTVDSQGCGSTIPGLGEALLGLGSVQLVTFQNLTSGDALLPVFVPNSPTLVGVEVGLQAVVADTTSAPIIVELSNALEATIGS